MPIKPSPGKLRLPTPVALPEPSIPSLLDGLHWQRPAVTRRHDLVIVVHGTFANPDHDAPSWSRPRLWWQSGGSFPRALDAALERHGSAARCGSIYDLDEKVRPGWIGWSGLNSEVERRRGAYELAEHLLALQRDPAVRRIHLVAHSHGGNVVRRALRYLNEPGLKIGAVVCLGTPFLHFADKAAWRRWVSRVHWPMLLVLVGLAAIMASIVEPAASGIDFGVYFVAAIGGAALYSLWRYARTSQASSDEGRAVLVRFRQDEAIQLLRTCAAITAEPHLYLRDLLGGPAKVRPMAPRSRPGPLMDWYDRFEAGVVTVWRLARHVAAAVSNVWNGPVCRAWERLATVAYHAPLAGSLASLLLIVAFRPYRPPLRPFLSSRMPRLASLFFHSMREEAERSFAVATAPKSRPGWDDPLKGTPFHADTARALAALTAAALYALLYPIDKLAGLPTWLGAVFSRFAILAGARAAAASVPGMDMLAAAFRPARTGCLPAGVSKVVVPRVIERGIEESLAATSRVNFAALRAGLDPARRASLLDAVTAVFTDVGLLHAQYYQDERIIDYVAQCIAGVEPRAWARDAAAPAPAVEPASNPSAGPSA